MIAIGKNEGYTLIELMIVVAIIGILASMAIPKFGELLWKAREASTKGSMGAVRSALSIYYSETEGQYIQFPAPGSQPAGYGMLLENALVPRWLDRMPKATPSHKHKGSSEVFLVWNLSGNQDNEPMSGYGWTYDANPWDDIKPVGYKGTWGTFGVLCRHSDSRGSNWSTY